MGTYPEYAAKLAIFAILLQDSDTKLSLLTYYKYLVDYDGIIRDASQLTRICDDFILAYDEIVTLEDRISISAKRQTIMISTLFEKYLIINKERNREIRDEVKKLIATVNKQNDEIDKAIVRFSNDRNN